MQNKLKSIHNNTVWLVYLLFLTGLLLYFPFLRGPLGSVRLIILYLHEVMGLMLAGLLFSYLSRINEHWQQLGNQPGKKRNTMLVVLLAAGWLVSGILLWIKGYISPGLAQVALLWHDWVTWLGMPYLAYHSVTRYLLLKSREEHETGNPLGELVSRKTFLRFLGGLAVIAATGGFLKLALGGKYFRGDSYNLKPLPQPAKNSKPPKGGGYKGSFREYSVSASEPDYKTENWRFTVTGLVNKELNFNWEQFLKIPRKVQVSDFHCVTGWTVYKVTYEGILLADLLAMAGVKPQAKYVKFYSGDGVYTDGLSLKQARMGDVLVALLMDGEPIVHKYGGPVRLIVPEMYGYKSVKWLEKIELTDKQPVGYWEERGYETDAFVKK